MSGAGPAEPSLDTMRILLGGARTMSGPQGLTLELCLTTLALPGEVLALRLEEIDFERGFGRVPARGGVERLLALPNVARRAIIRTAGEGRAIGQAVTAGRGAPLTAAQMRLDRLLDRLADAVPETVRLPTWNFHGIRHAAAMLLVEDGADAATVDAVLGVQHARDRSRVRGNAELAAIGVERWIAILENAARRPANRR